MSHIHEFHQAMITNGIGREAPPIDDGALHRFRIEGDKAGSLNGWYVLHGDGVPAGSYGSWKSGETFTWCAKSHTEMTETERADNRKRIEQVKKQRELQQKLVQKEVASKCLSLWEKANPQVSASHSYLESKKVRAYGVRQLSQACWYPCEMPTKS